jgi:competence protein ComFB
MKLKNYQEDVVLRAIEIALEDQPDLLADDAFVNDVAAYVLNRIPPRYVMSERGFLRLALESLDDEHEQKSLANVIELMILVNKGVDLVRGRRSAGALAEAEPAREAGSNGTRLRGQLEVEQGVEYVHNYPQFIGRVVDSRSGAPVLGATVTLFVDGDRVPPAAAGWQNPYITHDQTGAHFSFWPRPARSEKPHLRGKLLFTVDHPEYSTYSHVHEVVTEGDFGEEETIHGDKIVSLPPFAIARIDSAETGS